MIFVQLFRNRHLSQEKQVLSTAIPLFPALPATYIRENRGKKRVFEMQSEMFKAAVATVSVHSIVISSLNSDGRQESAILLQLDSVYRHMAEDGFQRNLNIAGSGFIFQGPRFAL